MPYNDANYGHKLNFHNYDAIVEHLKNGNC